MLAVYVIMETAAYGLHQRDQVMLARWRARRWA